MLTCKYHISLFFPLLLSNGCFVAFDLQQTICCTALARDALLRLLMEPR